MSDRGNQEGAQIKKHYRIKIKIEEKKERKKEGYAMLLENIDKQQEPSPVFRAHLKETVEAVDSYIVSSSLWSLLTVKTSRISSFFLRFFLHSFLSLFHDHFIELQN